MCVCVCNISVDPKTGRCERNACKVTEAMYAKYAGALRAVYTADRPAQPIFFIDATGCALGRGFTHAEIGTADFIGDTKQSRATLQSLAGYEGSDHTPDLLDNLPETLPSFNKMILAKKFTPTNATAPIPARPLIAADMQAVGGGSPPSINWAITY